MPTISIFWGIVILMYSDDHSPPHFHIRYGDYDAVYYLQNGVIRGEMPARIIKVVSQWLELHKEEVQANWDMLQQGKEPKSIEPLK